jgi:thiamine-monophosphate kinase
MTFVTISDEFSFIKKISPKILKQTSLIKGIGDDAALIRGNSEVEEIVCMDTMVEGVHFNEKTMSPFDIGYKALAVNVSDIAAMGGLPSFYLVSIAIPKAWNERELLQIYEGMNEIANIFNMDLIGGDTVSSKAALVITVTVLGYIEKGKHLLRSNAVAGDVLFVTGTLGDSAAGLELLLKNGRHYSFTNEQQFLVSRHQKPFPRVNEGRILAKRNRVALNDVSDGIASEAAEIAEASQVAIVIEKHLLPQSDELKKFPKEKQISWMLNGGEDFELIGAVSKEEWEILKSEFEKEKRSITKIGYVESGKGEVYLKEQDTLTPLLKAGYNHFK